MKKTIRVIVFILSILIAFTGCAQKTIQTSIESPALETADIFEHISRKKSYDNFVKAMASITVDSPDRKYTGKVAIMLKKPSCLRMDSIPLFGSSDFMLSTNETSFKVFIPDEEKFYVGKATAKNLYDFFGILLPPDDVVSILTGTPPGKSEKDHAFKVYWEGKLYRIEKILSTGEILSLWVKPNKKEIVRIKITKGDGGTLYTAWFEDYIYVEETAYPKKIKVVIEEPTKIYVRVLYSDIEVSKDEDISLFDLLPPQGLTPTFIY
jgi:hypothetical protein